MNILIDLLLDLVGEGFGPSTARGLLATFAVVCLVLLSISAWMLTTSADALQLPSWSVPLFAASIIIGGSGMVTASLHAARDASDRWLSIVSAVIGCLTAGLPIVWLAVR